MARRVAPLVVPAEQQAELRRVLNRSTSTQREVRRARIILERASGLSQEETARRVGVNRPVVALWERRFRMKGLAGLTDEKGRGRKPSIANEKRERVIVGATQPPARKRRWSVRTMAREANVSPATVQRLWASNDIKPHLTRTFKLSTDPDFEPKFWDVIGLYLNPPAKALVLCCDEKSQCQALERTQLGLPLAPKRPPTMTHDYVRHGTVTLFAALSQLTGQLITRTEASHTHVEWLRFLKQIDRETPQDLDLHLIADNYATHKHPKVRAWLEKHPRFTMHFTPTSSSWLNLVERFFADLTSDVIRSGSFCSVNELVRDIKAYLAERNADPRPYVWRAEGADILAKIKRARVALDATRAA